MVRINNDPCLPRAQRPCSGLAIGLETGLLRRGVLIKIYLRNKNGTLAYRFVPSIQDSIIVQTTIEKKKRIRAGRDRLK